MKIGVAIITCDRYQYAKDCYDSILRNRGVVNEIIVVNDGQFIPQTAISTNPNHTVFNNNPPYQSVGKSKNFAMKELLDRGCYYIFLIEDDMLIQREDVWHRYIVLSSISKIHHLNFAWHGPMNLQENGIPKPHRTIEYQPGISMAFVEHCVGSFSYYTKPFIEKVGGHDETFHNAFEHVEYAYRAIRMGLLPPFWYFPDLAESYKYVAENNSRPFYSAIRHNPDWKLNYDNAIAHYTKLYGHGPGDLPRVPWENAFEAIKRIYQS